MQTCQHEQQPDAHVGAVMQSGCPEPGCEAEGGAGMTSLFHRPEKIRGQLSVRGYFGRLALKVSESLQKALGGERLDHEEPNVVSTFIGPRQLHSDGWTKCDRIYLRAEQIGEIKKSHTNPRGVTTCFANSTQVAGWHPQWCLEQHLSTVEQRKAASASLQR